MTDNGDIMTNSSSYLICDSSFTAIVIDKDFISKLIWHQPKEDPVVLFESLKSIQWKSSDEN